MPGAQGGGSGSPSCVVEGVVALLMTFSGFPDAAIEFYLGLEADNSKAYWQAHKQQYEDSVRAPLEELLEELEAEFGVGKMFRPYRDVRFSKDKSPYKTAAGAQLSGGGYVHLSSEGLAVGAGYYMIEPRQLQALRDAILDEKAGPAVVKITDALVRDGAELISQGTLATAPRGVAKDHPRIALLRMKGLAVWWEHAPGPWLSTAEAKHVVVDHFREAQPLMEWLDTNVGK